MTFLACGPLLLSSFQILCGFAALLFVPALLLLAFYSPPKVPSKAPRLIIEGYPVVGALRFLTARWDFFRDNMASPTTENFSFHIGRIPIIGLSGDLDRSVFFGSPHLGFAEGQAQFNCFH